MSESNGKNDLISLDGSIADGLSHCETNRTLRALAPVIDRRVENVQPMRDTGRKRLDIARIFTVVTFAKVCAHADGRDEEMGRCGAIKVRPKRICETISKTFRSRRCGFSGDLRVGHSE